MKHRSVIQLFSYSVIFFFASCVDYPIYDRPGSITFTATHDCEIFLFTSDTVQIARDYYELGKAPFIVPMKETGVFIVHAVGAGLAPAPAPAHNPFKETLIYPGGHIEFYIEF